MKFFVIMPSGKHGEYKDGIEEADYIFREIICRAITGAAAEYGQIINPKSQFDKTEDVEVSIEREIDELSPGAINKSIVRKTAHADYVIVDITGSNPNVFFELGLRYTFKPHGTILIRQKGSYIPFDVSAYRCIDYESKFFGVEKAVSQIKESLLSLLEKEQIDSLVYDTFPHLTLSFDKKYSAESEEHKVMPWSDFWNKFQSCLEILKSANYKPDFIIGISNGGMFLADSASRLLYNDIPIVSLWADRKNKAKEFFKNQINESLIKIVGQKSRTKVIKLLIFDDIVATGTTWVKLKEFLKENLTKYSLLFIPLFSRGKKYLNLIEEDTMWGNSYFNDHLPPGKSFEDFCHTEYLHLPYSKEINVSVK